MCVLIASCSRDATHSFTYYSAELRAAAEQGDRDAQSKLGYSYFYGRGIPKDDGAAIEWLHLAAQQGQVDAQYLLGLCYLIGGGVPQDEEVALFWYEEAAQSGHVGAFFMLHILELENSEEYHQMRMRINYGNVRERNGKPFSIVLPESNGIQEPLSNQLPRITRNRIFDAFDIMHHDPDSTHISYPIVRPLTATIAKQYRVDGQTSFYSPSRNTIYVSSTTTLFCFNHELGNKLNFEIKKRSRGDD